MIVLASTSPQRRAILEQLQIPFRVVPPTYEEVGADPVEHAVGKARSVDGAGEPVLGVDTVVVLDGRRAGQACGRRGSVSRCSVGSPGGPTTSCPGSAYAPTTGRKAAGP